MLGGGWLVYHNNTFGFSINILALSVNTRGAEEIVSVLSGCQAEHFIYTFVFSARWWPQPNPP